MNTPKIPGPLGDAPRITDWVRFAPERKLQVLSGRVELGQGNLTAIAQMAAEELDLDLSQVAITGADTTKTPNEGFTAGSMSIVAGGMAVRWAASAARHVLLAEAAKLLQARPEALTLENGQVLRDGEATPLDLWKLAETADLNVPAADHARPKPSAERRLSGRPLPRIDIADRVSGPYFVHDLQLPGMLHGRPLHPPHLKAALVSLDLDGVRARPGVVAVVRDGSFVGIVAERELDAIAAQRWAAARAEWASGPEAPSDPIAVIAASEADTELSHEAGDPGAAEGTVVEITVSRPYLGHGSIGPSAAVAKWREDGVSVWTHSQGVYPLRAALSDVLGLPPAQIAVMHRPGAGCYGHNGADDVALDAALMARAVPGRPVKVVWSRADEFRCAPLGPGMSTHARAVVGADGRIAAMEVTANSAPHGNRPGRNGAPNLRAAAYLEKPFPVPRSLDVPLAVGGGTERNAIPYYAIPNQRTLKRVVHDLPYRTSSLRALGAFTNVYAIETLMDAIAAETGQDPVALRLAHLEDPRARAVIERVVADSADLIEGEMPEGAGWGLGFARYKNTAAYCAVIARIELDESLRVTHMRAAIDTGETINPDGVINQTEGGMLQALSWATKEAVRFDGPAVATETWDDYPILRFSELPDVSVSLIDRPDDPPLGCAEAAAGPVAAAIGNAVFQATGVHVKNLPLTRDAILRAIM